MTGVIGGVLIGVPAVRLRGPYLAIATFGLMLAFPQILKIKFLAQWTNGAYGIGGSRVDPPGIMGGFLDSGQWLYYLTMLAVVIMTLLFWNLTRSRIGRAFIALRNSEIGAEQMGGAPMGLLGGFSDQSRKTYSDECGIQARPLLIIR